MEISEDDDYDIEEDANNKYDICSKSREHEGFDKEKSDLEETLPPERQGDTNSIVDYLKNKLEVEKDDYEFEIIVYHFFKDDFF